MKCSTTAREGRSFKIKKILVSSIVGTCSPVDSRNYKISQSSYLWNSMNLLWCHLIIYKIIFKAKTLKIDYSSNKMKHSFISFKVVSSSCFHTLETHDKTFYGHCNVYCQTVVLHWQTTSFKVWIPSTSIILWMVKSRYIYQTHCDLCSPATEYS